MNMSWMIPMSLIWMVITGALIYRIYLSIKGRRAQQNRVFQAMQDQGEDFDPAENPLPKPALRAIVTSKEFWRTLFWAFTTAGFMMFIVEETMQVRGFGRYGLQQGKLWQEAATAANYSAGALRRDRGIIKALTLLNPPAGYVFGRYVDAEEKKLSWEMQRIEKELSKLNSRVTVIEETLRIKPINTIPDAVGKLAAVPARPVFPIAQADGGLRYPKQIDYTTHDQRVKTQKGFVYVTQYGQKFHRVSCRSLKGRNQVLKLPKTQAEADGKTGCYICKP